MSLLLLLTMTLQLAGAEVLLEHAPPPIHPVNAIEPGVVVLTALVGPDGRPSGLKVVSGATPFASPAVEAVRRWRFHNESDESIPVSVTFLFRPRVVFPHTPAPLTPSIPARPGAGAPPLPLLLVDPGYPPASVAEGAVVLQAVVDSAGVPQEVRVIRQASALDEVAASALRQWRFQPARREGREVRGIAIAVVSFLRP